MSPLILHHYDFSNFAEKARLMLGFKGLAWRGVELQFVAPQFDAQAILNIGFPLFFLVIGVQNATSDSVQPDSSARLCPRSKQISDHRIISRKRFRSLVPVKLIVPCRGIR